MLNKDLNFETAGATDFLEFVTANIEDTTTENGYTMPADFQKQQIVLAYFIAEKFHGDRKRKSGKLYFTHVKKVVGNLVKFFKEKDYRIIVAALLHDVIEDELLKVGKEYKLSHFDESMDGLDISSMHPKTIGNLFEEAFEEFGKMFGEDVKEMLEGLTNSEKVLGPVLSLSGEMKFYRDKVGFSTAKHPGILKIKICDMFDNVVVPAQDNKAEYKSVSNALARLKKYEQAIQPLSASITMHFGTFSSEASVEDRETARRMLGEISSTLHYVIPALETEIERGEGENKIKEGAPKIR